MCPNTPMIMRAAQQVALIAQARLMLRSNAGSRLTFAIADAPGQQERVLDQGYQAAADADVRMPE